MSVTYKHAPLAAGARFDALITFSLESGATISSTKAALIDTLPGSASVTKITAEVTGSNISGTQYQFTFDSDETAKLLRTPADRTSAIKHSLVYLAVLAAGTDGSSSAKTWAFYSNEIKVSSSVLSA